MPGILKGRRLRRKKESTDPSWRSLADCCGGSVFYRKFLLKFAHNLRHFISETMKNGFPPTVEGKKKIMFLFGVSSVQPLDGFMFSVMSLLSSCLL